MLNDHETKRTKCGVIQCDRAATSGADQNTKAGHNRRQYVSEGVACGEPRTTPW